jgi:hypothetical protein
MCPLEMADYIGSGQLTATARIVKPRRCEGSGFEQRFQPVVQLQRFGSVLGQIDFEDIH